MAKASRWARWPTATAATMGFLPELIGRRHRRDAQAAGTSQPVRGVVDPDHGGEVEDVGASQDRDHEIGADVALDAKLRVAMRAELGALRDRLGVTTV